MNTQEIKDLVKTYGTQTDFAQALAAQIGPDSRIIQQSVSQWILRGSIPVRYCGHIEALTGGRVTAHTIRPDVFPPV